MKTHNNDNERLCVTANDLREILVSLDSVGDIHFVILREDTFGKYLVSEFIYLGQIKCCMFAIGIPYEGVKYELKRQLTPNPFYRFIEYELDMS